ncbi:hypothetical protein C7M84_024708 [Penaeus vannamei]|uniref:Uncharacterized protein n=1 Tax=Penaeus vannamei TaxID=6689 RepID=A0A3R7SYS3_PENVA|nr:hypothetical protein C7M84_024708 [Penaeus vannamei]
MEPSRGKANTSEAHLPRRGCLLAQKGLSTPSPFPEAAQQGSNSPPSRGAALAGAARGRRGRSPRAASPGNSACKHQEQRRALTCLLIWTRFLVHPRQQIFFLSLGNDISQTEGYGLEWQEERV